MRKIIKAAFCDGKTSSIGSVNVVAEQFYETLKGLEDGQRKLVRSAICSAGMGHLTQGLNALLLQVTIALAAVVFIVLGLPL